VPELFKVFLLLILLISGNFVASTPPCAARKVLRNSHCSRSVKILKGPAVAVKAVMVPDVDYLVKSGGRT